MEKIKSNVKKTGNTVMDVLKTIAKFLLGVSAIGCATFTVIFATRCNYAMKYQYILYGMATVVYGTVGALVIILIHNNKD